MLVGCDVGGFYRSTDGGAGYTISNAGLRDDFVECIVPDPLDPEVIYLGCQSGVHKSTDRGGTWQWLREGFPPKNRWDWSAPIGALAIDPRDPAVLYAGIGRPRWQQFGKGAVYKTVDGGAHWKQVNAPGSLPADALVTDLAIDPRDSRRLLLACQYGVYRSEDGGVGWVLTIAGLPHPHVRRIAFCRGQPEIVYLTLWAKPGQQPWQGGVYRSIDGGKSWSPRTQGLTQYVGKPGEASQMTANYDRLVVHPDNPDVVYVGGWSWVNADIYKTTDGGRTWTGTVRRGTGGNTEDGWITFWGPDVQCLSMSPFDPETLYFGTSGKVHKTTDGAGHWQQIYTRMLPDGRFQGTGLEVTCVVDVVVHPADPQRLYFCYLDIGLLISEDGGQSFRRGVQGVTPSAMQGNCYALVFDPADAEHCWGSFGSASVAVVAESYDSGDTWTTVGTTAGGLPGVPHRVLRVEAAGPADRGRGQAGRLRQRRRRTHLAAASERLAPWRRARPRRGSHASGLLVVCPGRRRNESRRGVPHLRRGTLLAADQPRPAGGRRTAARARPERSPASLPGGSRPLHGRADLPGRRLSQRRQRRHLAAHPRG